MEGGILGIVVLVADIWAVLNIVQSKAETGPKVLWIAAVILLPVLGFIAWFMAGPRSR
jgi:succinate dehydrogenase/fumarate reductase cytochrome b subunit